MEYASIALVSGKGGVGKTTITVNIAWLLSNTSAKVVVIDLDFQNLGCTGLIASHYNLQDSNAPALLQTDEKIENCPISLTYITENLQFLPAALITGTKERHDNIYEVPEDIYQRLPKLLNHLHQRFSIDCFVLDCHGGIDKTSFAAAGICDYTFIVTEADTVTFAGTLSLVDGYYDQYKSSERKPAIEYIVNRIPPKYKWNDLDKV